MGSLLKDLVKIIRHILRQNPHFHVEVRPTYEGIKLVFVSPHDHDDAEILYLYHDSIWWYRHWPGGGSENFHAWRITEHSVDYAGSANEDLPPPVNLS